MSQEARYLNERLFRKLRLIQEQIGPVELTKDDDDESFAFMPAPGVFAEIKRQLVKRKLLVLPELTSAESIEGSGGKRGTRVYLHIALIDVPSGESRRGTWAGESFDQERALAHATTWALKGFYVATFLIQPAESTPKGRHDARQRAVRANLKVTPGQVEKARKEFAELGFTDDEVAEMLQNEFNVGELTGVPRDKFDRLLELIRAEPTS